MAKKQLEKEMGRCQHEIITEMPVHELNANDIVHNVSNIVWAISRKA
jgi:hypothetical protein